MFWSVDISIPEVESFEWALALSEYPISSFSGFSSEMSLPKDEWTYSTNLTLMTTPINKGESFNKQWQAYAVKPSQLDKQQTLIDEEQVIINNFKALYKKQRLLLDQGEKISSYKLMSNEVIERAEERLKQKKEKLFEMQNYKVPVVRFDDIADEAYTVDYPRQHAFVKRNDRTYMFFLSNRGKEKWLSEGANATVEQIHAILKRFEARKLGEVPKEKGFCFPYGFIHDDGKPDYAIKNSFRFKDQPNVAYVIYTGNNTRLSRGQIATHGVIHTRMPTVYKGYQGNPVEQTLTLKNGNTLTLKGWEITEKIPKDPKGPEHHYWVYGELKAKNSQPNDSFVAIQIDAFVKNPEQGRPNNAPPLKEAIKRLVPILETIQ